MRDNDAMTSDMKWFAICAAVCAAFVLYTYYASNVERAARMSKHVAVARDRIAASNNVKRAMSRQSHDLTEMESLETATRARVPHIAPE